MTQSPPVRPRDPANPLAELWREALSRPFHSPACGCAIPSSVRLDAATLELDLLDYVEHKHGLDALPVWNEAVTRRGQAPSGNFPDWLLSLNGSVVEARLHAIVMASLEASLQSMTAHAANRLVPATALGAGWLAGTRSDSTTR